MFMDNPSGIVGDSFNELLGFDGNGALINCASPKSRHLPFVADPVCAVGINFMLCRGANGFRDVNLPEIF
jgi:hypothetical protein